MPDNVLSESEQIGCRPVSEAGHQPANRNKRVTRRTKLTDKLLKSLKPSSDGRPYEVMDTVVSQMGVRVMGTVSHVVLTFVLIARFPPSKHPTRRALGSYLDPDIALKREEVTIEELLMLDALSLAEGRRKGQMWLDLIARGIDPAEHRAWRLKAIEKQREAEAEKRENIVEKVLDAFVARKLVKQRKGKEVERNIRNQFLETWKGRPITEISELDVLKIINVKVQTAPGRARNLLSDIRQFFKWAIAQRVYGVTLNPCANLRPKDLFGKKRKRQRILNNDELFALWRAVLRLPYPHQQVYQVLILAGLRLNAAADAMWSEFNSAVVRALRQRTKGERIDWSKFTAEQLTWIIPSQRMKGDDADARPHLVPLTPDILQILETLPLFERGDYLFSTTFGKKPAWMSDKVKKQIDARMLRTLRALARERGDDPARVELEPWINHDLRRVVRSNLSRLRVTEEAREAVLAHARPGIKGVYDVYDYGDEKREALELWAQRLRSIVQPSPSDKVIPIRARG
jgi:hypothetical protein